jgi:DNA-binding response OmpR family regulator
MHHSPQTPLARSGAPDCAVLLAEDQPDSAQLLQRYLARQGVTVDWARNGREALELYARRPFPIVITDLAMPEMDGRALIQELNRLAAPPIIIVASADDDILHVIETMRLGVHDYLIKPLGFEDLLGKVERAAEVARLRRMERAVELERQIRLQRQLEWSDWKERMTHRRFDRLDQNLFHNLRTNFSQGYGLGVLLTLLSLIEEQSESVPGGRLVDGELLDLAFANAAVARRALETFSEIDDILKRDFPLEAASVLDVHNLLLAAVAAAGPAAELGGHQIEAGAAPGGGE